MATTKACITGELLVRPGRASLPGRSSRAAARSPALARITARHQSTLPTARVSPLAGGLRESAGPLGPARCLRSSRRRALDVSASSQGNDHAGYIEDIGAMRPPSELPVLLAILEAKGEEIVPPSERGGIHPLVIPLSRQPNGHVTGLLRWPTPPEDFNMPVVSAGSTGIVLLGRTPKEYIHRALVEEDAAGGAGPVAAAAGQLGEQLYPEGDFAKSGSKLAVYLTTKVGKFPDVMETLSLGHLERGDETSALVAGEWYNKGHFPGWGQPFAFNAALFAKVGRDQEARDSARIALRSPWWTLGVDFAELKETAGFGDQPVTWVQERLTAEAAAADITAGKSPEQIAVDQAALMMDEACAEESASDGSQWDNLREVLAGKYTEAGLTELARFINP